MVNVSQKKDWLVAYYSLSGNTRSLAKELASRLDADLLEIQSQRKYSSTAIGYIKAAYDTGLQRNVGFKFDSSPASLANYSGVVVASPVWMSSVAPPVQSFLQAYAREFNQVAFLVTLGGNGSIRAFKQMEAICGKTPVATIAMTAKDLTRSESDRVSQRLSEFAELLKSGAGRLAA
jgi:flavodoxin